MIDEENQQYQDPNSAASAAEAAQATGETLPIVGDVNEPLDWELQIAQAYQSSEASQTSGNAPATATQANFADPGLADALEFLKGGVGKRN